MRSSSKPLIIASRKSLLAKAQAQMVGRQLAQLNPNLVVEYLWIDSEGDTSPEVSLANAGGKGLFARAIEEAVWDRRADLAVHSLKDLPAQPGETPLGDRLTLAAIPPRADPRDCLITRKGLASLADLPNKALVGTASPRRAAQILRVRPDLRIELMRGNIDTRLRKVLQEKKYDATLLAVAGLQRAGFDEHTVHPLDPAIMLPAACQGALALQCRGDDHLTLMRCLALNDPASAAAVTAERQLVAALEGSCHSAIAVLVEPVNPPSLSTSAFRLRARVLSPDGRECLEADVTAPLKGLSKVVNHIARDLIQRGAKRVLMTKPTVT